MKRACEWALCVGSGSQPYSVRLGPARHRIQPGLARLGAIESLEVERRLIVGFYCAVPRKVDRNEMSIQSGVEHQMSVIRRDYPGPSKSLLPERMAREV